MCSNPSQRSDRGTAISRTPNHFAATFLYACLLNKLKRSALWGNDKECRLGCDRRLWDRDLGHNLKTVRNIDEGFIGDCNSNNTGAGNPSPWKWILLCMGGCGSLLVLSLWVFDLIFIRGAWWKKLRVSCTVSMRWDLKWECFVNWWETRRGFVGPWRKG